jgi:hypothetical protein
VNSQTLKVHFHFILLLYLVHKIFLCFSESVVIFVVMYVAYIGGEGWPERVMQKMLLDKNFLTAELGEQEADMIEKRNTYGQHEAVVLKLRAELSTLQTSRRALEVKLQTDKRVKYELDEHKKDEKKQLSNLEEKETNAEMANLLFEIKGKFTLYQQVF